MPNHSLRIEDHSLCAYLARRSTEEIEAILEYCHQENNIPYYEPVLPEIELLLQQRKQQAVIKEESAV